MLSELRRRTRRVIRKAYLPVMPERARDAQSIVTWKREQSDQLFYVFAGRGMGLMIEPMAFFRETGLFDTNFVMMRDFQRFFYHAGLSRELPDIDAIRRRLLACREEMPQVTESFCLGSSMGGHAAIVFGHHLKVDTVFAFGPQTLIDLRRLLAATGRTDASVFPEAHRDLRVLLGDHNGRTEYKIFYCADFEKDRRSAERLRGLPGVELFPQEGNSHTVVKEMQERGLLRDVLPLR